MARLTRASLLQFGIEMVQTALGFIAIVYFARRLGSATLGQYFLALAVVNWLLIPSTGIRGTMMKRVSEANDQDQFFTAGLIVQLIFLVILLVFLVVLRTPINNYLGFDGVALIGALTAVKALSTFQRAALRAEHRVELAAVVGGGWETLRIFLQVALVVTGFGLLGLLAGEIAAGVLTGVALIGILSLRIARPTRRHFQSLYDYGKYAWLGTIKPFAYSWVDVLVLGFFVSSSVIGVYEVAWRISAAFILLPTAMSKAVFPYLSRQASENELDKIRRTLRTATTFAGSIAIPGVVGALVIGSDLLRIYGQEFAAGTLFLVVLSFGRLGQCYETFLLQSLNAMDRPDVTFRISALFIAVNLTLNGVLIWQIGAIGAAIATAATMLLSTGLAVRALNDIVGFSVDWNTLGVQVVSATVMGVIVFWTREQITNVTEIETIALVVLGAVIYFTGLLVGADEARSQFRHAVSQSLNR